MTHKVTIAAHLRLQELYSGPSARYAELVYQGAIETLRFTGSTATVQSRAERRRQPLWIATTPVIDGRSGGQSVSWPGRET